MIERPVLFQQVVDRCEGGGPILKIYGYTKTKSQQHFTQSVYHVN